MKRMDLLRELQTLNVVDLETKLAEVKTQLLNMKIKSEAGLLKNPLSIRMLRRDIARINTILQQKRLGNKR